MATPRRSARPFVLRRLLEPQRDYPLVLAQAYDRLLQSSPGNAPGLPRDSFIPLTYHATAVSAPPSLSEPSLWTPPAIAPGQSAEPGRGSATH